jgi:hypothetical protein
MDRIEPVERQRAGGRGLDQRRHPGERRFPAAGFADDGERLAGLDREGDAADGLQARRRAEQAALDRVGLRQFARIDDRIRHGVDSVETTRLSASGAQNVALRIAERVVAADLAVLPGPQAPAGPGANDRWHRRSAG